MSIKKSKGVYRALLNQEGILAPVATVLENTLLPDGAELVWTRGGAGQYTATLVGAFPAAKTTIGQYGPTYNSATPSMILFNGGAVAGWLSFARWDDNSIGMISVLNDGAGNPDTDLSALLGAGSSVYIEINTF